MKGATVASSVCIDIRPINAIPESRFENVLISCLQILSGKSALCGFEPVYLQPPAEASLNGGQKIKGRQDQDECGRHYSDATTCHLRSVAHLPRLKGKEAHKSCARHFTAQHYLASFMKI